MLLGKLETPFTKVIQSGPFESTTITADYMVIGTQTYVMGENNVTFELRFGNIIIEDLNERFDIVSRHNLQMTQEELSTWGTDDTILFQLVADKIGVSIVETIIKDFHYTY